MKMKYQNITNMEKLHFKITINAPKEKVWDAMLSAETYPKWADAFMPGSHFVGNWNTGSTIKFLGPDQNGKLSGMISRIVENRPHEFISIEHLGLYQDGKEDTTSKEAKDWAGAHENYTFKNNGESTELHVEMDSVAGFKEMFLGLWPKALDKIKMLAEK